MDYTSIITAISSVGFPIVACIMVYRTMVETTKENHTQIKEVMTRHNEEVKALQTALDNMALTMQKALDDNTSVMRRLIDRIDDIGGIYNGKSEQ